MKYKQSGRFIVNVQLKATVALFGFFLLLGAFACNPEDVPPTWPQAIEMGPDVTEALATLIPTEGNMVTGTVNFIKSEGGIRIIADISGLEPGKHGFHIHQFGNCSAADGSSAGGHFNPLNEPHGAPTDAERHVGDLGNVIADEKGVAHYERIDGVISFTGIKSIIGRGVIVHSGEDDLKTQPTGNAGARAACGVIGIAGEEKKSGM
jgi:Cu-Zn family superoxide dismutase